MKENRKKKSCPLPSHEFWTKSVVSNDQSAQSMILCENIHVFQFKRFTKHQTQLRNAETPNTSRNHCNHDFPETLISVCLIYIPENSLSTNDERNRPRRPILRRGHRHHRHAPPPG